MKECFLLPNIDTKKPTMRLLQGLQRSLKRLRLTGSPPKTIILRHASNLPSDLKTTKLLEGYADSRYFILCVCGVVVLVLGLLVAYCGHEPSLDVCFGL